MHRYVSFDSELEVSLQLSKKLPDVLVKIGMALFLMLTAWQESSTSDFACQCVRVPLFLLEKWMHSNTFKLKLFCFLLKSRKKLGHRWFRILNQRMFRNCLFDSN